MTGETIKRQLETLLLNETVDGSLEPSIIRAHRLGAYAYGKAEGELKVLYKSDFLAAATRHHLVKTQLLPLIKAWRAAGIEVLLLKGVYQAEFVYEVAAERFYGDVDILIRPEDTVQAKVLAEDLGWWVMWQREGSSLRGHVHVDLHLVANDGQLELELHRFPVQSSAARVERQERITQAVWARSMDLTWEGLSVKGMHPVDALLVGLILNRTWSQWGVKPHDLLDMRALIARYGVTRQQVEARSAELGCSRTLRLFLGRCNPWENRLSLFKVPFWQRHVFTLRTRKENGNLVWQRFARKLRLSPRLLGYVLQVLPAVMQVKRYLRQTQDLHQLLAKVDTPGAVHSLEAIPPEWLSLAVHWATKLAAPHSKGTCVLRSLVLYSAAKARGENPVFCSGVRRAKQGLSGHAWIELNGRPLGKFGDLRAHHHYKVNFRYPSHA